MANIHGRDVEDEQEGCTSPVQEAENPKDMQEATHPTGTDERGASPARGGAGRATHSGRSGTQSLSRGIQVMRVLATRPEIGWRLSDLAAACALDKATAHRILTCLVNERLVQQRPADRRYLPGPLMYELGLSLQCQHQFHAVAQQRLDKWARGMNAVGCLMLRSGYEYVCSVRAGAAVLPGLMVDAGTRRPLFTSVGGVAMIHALGEAEARDVLQDNIGQEVLRRGTGRLAALERMRERSLRHGFGVNLGDVVPGVHAFAVPLRGPNDHVFASVCLVGESEQFPESQLPRIHAELMQVARELEAHATPSMFPAVPASA